MVEKKTKKKSESNGPGRKQMLVLWTAALAALCSTGIPRIVELLENKPSVEQVQGMIAEQTAVIAAQTGHLTKAYNRAVEMLRSIERRLDALEQRCLPLRSGRSRLRPKPAGGMAPGILGGDEKSNVVKRVPDFQGQTVQMQLQLALPLQEKEKS